MRKPNKSVPLQVAFGHGGYQCNRKQIKTDGYVIKSHNVIQLNLPVRLSLPLFSLPFLPLSSSSPFFFPFSTMAPASSGYPVECPIDPFYQADQTD